LRLIDGFNHSRQVTLDSWPACREQDDDRHPADRKILLVLEIPVRGDEDLEPCLLGRGNEFPVLKLRPALLVCGGHFVANQRPAQGHRRALVEQNFHSGGFEVMGKFVMR
jgi:hypothetical protein